MSLGDFAQLKLEKHQVFNGYDKGLSRNINCTFNMASLKKKKTGINIITIDDGELLRCPNHSCKELAQLLQNASELEFEKL